MKSARAGEMRTKITIKSLTAGVNASGYPTESWTNVFGGTNTVWCKWVNAHGLEVYENMRQDLGEVATITMRYSSLVNVRCRVSREADTEPYEIISIDNVEDGRKFLEIKVRRITKA